MTFEEWFKEENWGPAYGDDGEFHYGASVVWDYKQAEIDALKEVVNRERGQATEYYTDFHCAIAERDALQKRISVYEKHVGFIKNIHESEFNSESDTSWILGNLDGFFECLEIDLKGDKK